MKYRISMEFETPEELLEFLSKKDMIDNDVREKLGVQIKKSVRSSIRKFKRWEQFEIDQLILGYDKYTSEKLAEQLCRPASAVRNQIHKMIHGGLLRHKRIPNGKIKKSFL